MGEEHQKCPTGHFSTSTVRIINPVVVHLVALIAAPIVAVVLWTNAD